MANPIEGYLSHLTVRLAKRLPAYQVDEHVKEISNHLRENLSTRMAADESEATAAAHALKDMGSDFLVADSLIRAHSGIAKKSVWRLAWIPALLLAIGGLLPFVFVFGYYNDNLEEIALWLPWCFVLWFGVSCFRTRRIVLKPVLAALGVVMVVCLAQPWFWGPYGTLPSVSARRAEVVTQSNVDINKLSTELAMTKADDKTPYPTILRQGNSFLSPEPSSSPGLERSDIDPIGQSGPFLGVQLVPRASQSQARAAWRDLKPAFVSQLHSNLSETRANLATWQKVNPGLAEAVDLGKNVLVMFLQAAAVIAAVNLLALLAVEIRRRIVTMAWNRRRWA